MYLLSLVKRYWFFLQWFFLLYLVSLGCKKQSENSNSQLEIPEAKSLSLTHCGSCHQYPEPSLLPKEIWKRSILPNMGRRLGMDHHSIMPDYPHINPDIEADEQKLTQEDWDKLFLYYLSNAPDSLTTPQITYPSLQEIGYSVDAVKTPTEMSNVISYLNFDSENGDVYIGDAGNNALNIFDMELNSKVVFEFKSPVIDLTRRDGIYYVSTIGKMPPNDELKGKVTEINTLTNQRRVLIDSLRRPVKVIFHDFNRDDESEILICEYGNNVGQLSLFTKADDETYRKKTLIESPGAIKTIITDFNDNGRDDIMVLFAQGDERIELLINKGDETFTRQLLLQFPPVYGSYDMEWADINGDGNKELLYANGDNGDLSTILKPYHGLHIFEKTGTYAFTERLFSTFYGASKIELADLDGDSDSDIFLTSTFPADKQIHRSPGIALFENNSSPQQFSFTPYQIQESLGRSFTVLSVRGFEGNGKHEIVAGAMDFRYYQQTSTQDGSHDTPKQPSLITISYP